MNLKRKLICSSILALSSTSALAADLNLPFTVFGQFEYSISDRAGIKEQGDNQHRQRSHPGLLLELGSQLPLKTSSFTTEIFVSTKLVSGDANPSWTNSVGNREAWGALNSNEFGKFRFGRQWVDTYINIMDPYASGGNIGEMSELGTGVAKGYPAGLTRISNAIWADNSLTYTSPKLAGTTTIRGQYYWNGVSFNDETLASGTAPNVAPNTKGANGYVLAARYEIPAVRIDASFGGQKQNLSGAKATDGVVIGNGVYDTTQLALGAMVPVGDHKVRFLINQDKTKLPSGNTVKDTELILGAHVAVTPAFHLRPAYINHKVDGIGANTADFQQVRVELGYKFNIGEKHGATTLWARPMYRKWATGEKFTELRVGFTSNF